MDFEKTLLGILSPEQLKIAEPMAKHTTFQVGGPADYYVTPNLAQLPEVITLCEQNNVPWMVIGNGSNLLVSDKGIRGVVLSLGRPMSQIRTEGDRIEAEAGALLSVVAKEAYNRGLGGMEFASGIPGTIGGALVMNAGAYGGEMKQILESVTVRTKDGTIETWDVARYDGGYRTSEVMRQGALVLSAVLSLHKAPQEDIKRTMDELKEKRTSKQPLEYPSAGSTFKRPEGQFAGRLIEDSGLRGYRVGGAQVSEKHCGFVINRGEATAEDIRCLMDDVTKKVQQDSGITLEPEVRIIGEW